MAKTILIVDDSASLRQVVAIALKGGGYDVLEACDGKDALGKLTGQKIHLIISDVNMPNMNGFDLLKAVKADESLKQRYERCVATGSPGIARDDLLSRVRERGTDLSQALHQHFDAHPHVGDIRGRGLFWGVELVADRDTKQWFDPSLRLHARIKSEAMKRGLMVYPMGGTIDGVRGDHVLLAPPFISTTADIEEIVSLLDASINSAIQLTRV